MLYTIENFKLLKKTSLVYQDEVVFIEGGNTFTVSVIGSSEDPRYFIFAKPTYLGEGVQIYSCSDTKTLTRKVLNAFYYLNQPHESLIPIPEMLPGTSVCYLHSSHLEGRCIQFDELVSFPLDRSAYSVNRKPCSYYLREIDGGGVLVEDESMGGLQLQIVKIFKLFEEIEEIKEIENIFTSFSFNPLIKIGDRVKFPRTKEVYTLDITRDKKTGLKEIKSGEFLFSANKIAELRLLIKGEFEIQERLQEKKEYFITYTFSNQFEGGKILKVGDRVRFPKMDAFTVDENSNHFFRLLNEKKEYFCIDSGGVACVVSTAKLKSLTKEVIKLFKQFEGEFVEIAPVPEAPVEKTPVPEVPVKEVLPAEVPDPSSVTYTSSEQLKKKNLKLRDWVQFKTDMNYRVCYDPSATRTFYGLYPEGDIKKSPLESSPSLDYLTIFAEKVFKNIEDEVKSAEAKAANLLPSFPDESKASESSKEEIPRLEIILKVITSKKISSKNIAEIGRKFNYPQIWNQIALSYGILEEAKWIVKSSNLVEGNVYFFSGLCESLKPGEEEEEFLLTNILLLPTEESMMAWEAFAKRLEYQDLESEKSEK